MRRISSPRLARAIVDLPDDPEPNGTSKRPLPEGAKVYVPGGANIFDVELGELMHGVVYTIEYDDGAINSGLVRIVTVIDGNAYRMGFAEGDPRSR